MKAGRASRASSIVGCIATVAALAVAGCAAPDRADPGSAASPSSPSSPPPSSTTPSGRPDRTTVVLQDQQLVMTTHGSSTCPYRVRDVEQLDEHRVRITPLRYPDDRVCTMDYRPSTVRVPLPPGLSGETLRVAVVVLESGRVTQVPVDTH